MRIFRVMRSMVALGVFAAAPVMANDWVFINANVLTMNDDQPTAEAVVVENGRITYVGGSDQARALRPAGADIVDLDGLTLMPGIHDVHVHALEAGSTVGGNCWLQAERIRDMGAEVRACRDQQAGTDWLLAYGHSLEALLELDVSPKRLLDQWVSDRPVAIMDESSHSVWVNSRALKRMAIDRGTADPTGGVILRDADGEATGVLLDAAGEWAFDLALQPNSKAFELNYDGLAWSMDQLASNGITSIADARVYWQRGWLDVWHQAEQDGLLKARVNLGLWAYPLMDDDTQLNTLASLYHADPDSLIQTNQVKIYSDGIIHNTTAALKRPYQYNRPQTPPLGLNYFDEERLYRYIDRLQAVGFDMHIHTIGDRGVHEALNAIERAEDGREHRHRLTHVELVDDADLPRFKQLGVIADMQVAGAFSLPENHDWQEPYIGDRVHQSYRLGDLVDTGARVTLSSDWTVNSLNPFLGIERAVDRGEQSVDLDTALKAYTLNAAYALRSEDRTGSIETGKLADLIVIDQDPYQVPVTALSETTVLWTLLAGEITYQDPTF